MGRTTVEQSTNSYIVTNRLAHPEALNERELNSLAGKLLETLIPVITETTKKGMILKSAIVDMIPLRAYFSGIVTREMFLNVVMQLIDIVQDCKKSFMNENNLMLDFDYIFLHPRTKKLKCIFWPIVNNQNQHIASEFFKDLPFRVIFSKHEDHGYVSNYLQFFQQQHAPFSINSFEKLILEMTGKSVEGKSFLPTDSVQLENSKNPSNKLAGEKGNTGNIACNSFGQQNRATVPNLVQSRDCAKCGSTNKEDANFCVSCGSPFHLEKERLVESFVAVKIDPVSQAHGGTNTQTFSETTVLGAEDFDSGTTVLDADSLEEPSYPYLIREKSQEKISVDKPSFRIGKERRYCDYFIGDNNAVSRSHADILTKAGRYYIVDNNSTNKTYVDGRTVPVQKEVEIFSGTKLRLANEDFVFYI